jgi:pheromone shutdown protein TraB
MIGDDDPRVTGDNVRQLPAATAGAAVTLVGVVHDHPASKYRTRRLVEETDPDVLALELPTLAVGLFREYARDERTPPAFGGEMSTAIQAADTEHVVGIDGPSIEFVRYLLGALVHEDHSRETVGTIVDSLASVTKHATACKLAERVASTTGLRVEVDTPVPHELNLEAPPAEQARDEAAQIRQAKTVMKAFQSSSASDIRKETREQYMADQLATLREEGSVVAVVGIAHLDAVAAKLGPG